MVTCPSSSGSRSASNALPRKLRQHVGAVLVGDALCLAIRHIAVIHDPNLIGYEHMPRWIRAHRTGIRPNSGYLPHVQWNMNTDGLPKHFAKHGCDLHANEDQNEPRKWALYLGYEPQITKAWVLHALGTEPMT